MSKRVKVVRYENNIITLKVDGRLLAYFVDRPQPLGPADSAMLRNAMDTRLLDAMFGLVRPQRRLFSWFSGLKKVGTAVCMLSVAATSFSVHGFLAFHSNVFILSGICGVVGFVASIYMLRERTERVLQRTGRVLLLGEAVADYVERVGTEIDIGKGKALVIPRSDVDKIRKGDIKGDII